MTTLKFSNYSGYVCNITIHDTDNDLYYYHSIGVNFSDYALIINFNYTFKFDITIDTDNALLTTTDPNVAIYINDGSALGTTSCQNDENINYEPPDNLDYSNSKIMIADATKVYLELPPNKFCSKQLNSFSAGYIFNYTKDDAGTVQSNTNINTATNDSMTLILFFILVFIVILILLAIGFGGYWIYKKYK